MPRKVRDYQKERKYDSKPEVKKKRAARNRARRKLMKEGLVSVGDGKDVGHKTPLSKGGTNSRANLRVESKRQNRSYKRTKSGKIK